MKLSLLINMKMPTKVGIFIFISREIFMLAKFSKKEFAIFSNLRLAGQVSCLAELSMKKVL